MQTMQIFKKTLLRLGAGLIGLGIMIGGAAGYYAQRLPDHYYWESDQPFSIAAAFPVTITGEAETVPAMQQAEVRLFGIIPVKTVSLTAVEPREVFVGGEPFGIRMLMAGVMVVSLDDVVTMSGESCPARDAGIQVGDVIQAVDGKQISGNSDLQSAVFGSEGKAVPVTYLRNGIRETVMITPVFSSIHGCYQTGMWVRDSTAGIGTVTYYVPAENGTVRFGGLGHAVCDPDTGEQIPLASGDVLKADVTDVLAGCAGRPGELRGHFDTDSAMGTLLSNTASGVFGILKALPHPERDPIPLGYQQDIHLGDAIMFTTILGDLPAAYSIEIEEIHGGVSGSRNLVVHVTDETLLERSGGIVQGMSGSPIVQDGKLVGAVTHVFVKDPTRGYGILAENMYAQTAAGMTA